MINTYFNKAFAISFGAHVLFFWSVYFTFNWPLATSSATSVSFLGSILGSGDFVRFTSSNKINIFIYKAKAKPDFSLLHISRVKKPTPMSYSVSGNLKQLNKSLVATKKEESKTGFIQKSFEPGAWEEIKLELKTE